jgi:GST-like protein
MIDFYTWPTPNGFKISIMLEELAVEYRTIPVNIGAGEQFNPDFLRVSPNNKIPAIVDHDTADGQSLSIFESGAILMYLAEKTGRLWPVDTRQRYRVAQWLMWQMAGLGPMLGQSSHFRRAAPEKLAYAIERYGKESVRLLGVLDQALADQEYIAGEYSIADVACYPWSLSPAFQQLPIPDFTNLKRWQTAMAARPAVNRGMRLLPEFQHRPPVDTAAEPDIGYR